MKKFVVLCLIIVLSFSSSIISFAENPKEKVLIINSEIKDYDTLLKRAQKNIHDLDLSEFPLIGKYTYKLTKNGVDQEITTNITSQLLKRTIKDGKVAEIYAVTSLGSGTLYDEMWDGSISVKTYSTIYYSVDSSGPTGTALLTKVTGGWYIDDRTVSVSNRKVIYVTNGWGPTGYFLNQRVEKNASANTFTYYTGFNKWIFNDSGYPGNMLGCRTECTLKHGSASVWYLTFNNDLL
ncbi:MAG: hypothetical protein GXY17_07825 [Clostridiaceae bacterium]|jgi:hypothetical protein|nr:hypothetical protein [Clostridiaceae bacterium]